MTDRLKHLKQLLDEVNRPTSVLLVDDDAEFGKLLKQAFADQGFELETVESGERAVERIRSGQKPDVIFLDLRLTGIDGVEVFKRIREMDEKLPVAFIAGLAEGHKLSKILAYGWATIVPKPSSQSSMKNLCHVAGVLANG